MTGRSAPTATIARVFSGLKPGDIRNLTLDLILLCYSVSFAIEKVVLRDWTWAAVYGTFSLVCCGVFVWDLLLDIRELRAAEAVPDPQERTQP